MSLQYGSGVEQFMYHSSSKYIGVLMVLYGCVSPYFIEFTGCDPLSYGLDVPIYLVVTISDDYSSIFFMNVYVNEAIEKNGRIQWRSKP